MPTGVFLYNSLTITYFHTGCRRRPAMAGGAMSGNARQSNRRKVVSRSCEWSEVGQCPAEQKNHGPGTQSISSCRSSAPMRKTPARSLTGVSLYNSLTITYFHTGCSTIIGAKSFHGPVRDGKGWDRLAMVIRHDLYVIALPTGQRDDSSGRSKVWGISQTQANAP
jgi:hypothetical protein